MWKYQLRDDVFSLVTHSRVATVREKSGPEKQFFKVREKSGNFVKGQGKS